MCVHVAFEAIAATCLCLCIHTIVWILVQLIHVLLFPDRGHSVHDNTVVTVIA